MTNNAKSKAKFKPNREPLSPGAPDIAEGIFGQPAIPRPPEPDYDAANAFWTGREAAYYLFIGRDAEFISGYLEEVAAWSDPPDLKPLYTIIAKLREGRE